MRTIVLLLVAGVAAAHAQAQERAAPPIRDNSFLVEEAYNQEARVVQHISVLTLARGSDDWEYGFTQEWPAGSQRHQVGMTIPLLSVADASGVGDIALNYRYQLFFDDASGNAVAPRLSLILPSGDSDAGRGTGSLGVQANLPVSWGWSRTLVTHWNLGGTWTPSARAPLGGRVATRDIAAAASIIWLPVRAVNLMLEAAWVREEIAIAADTRSAEESAFIAPGARAAIDFANGLQVVPGIAFPIGIGSTDGERRVLFYLSLEHGF